MRPITWIVGLALLVMAAGAPAGDRVVLRNTSGDENGLLVDGKFGGVDRNDETFRSPQTSVDVGSVERSQSSNEIVAFTTNRPPQIRTSVSWSPNNDTVRTTFRKVIKIRVAFWIVHGGFQTQRTKLQGDATTTNDIWAGERMGLKLVTGSADFHDLTGQAHGLLDFTDCQTQEGKLRNAGEEAERINVYIVRTVYGDPGYGESCGIGSGFVVMGSGAGNTLLAHELGHNLGLYHPPSQPAGLYDDTNVMFQFSTQRRYLTEGQVFRANFGQDTVLAWLYKKTTGTRPCDLVAATDQCPAAVKRIWADGPNFPPN